MLSKKNIQQQAMPKAGIFKTSNKKKNEATFDFPGFQDDIRLHAYYNYLSRVKNNFPGDEMGDWLEAERSLTGKASTH